MKKTRFCFALILAGLLLSGITGSYAQNIDINAGYGNYEPGHFPGYGNNPAAEGIFYSSAGKTSGVIPPYTAQLTIVLAPQVPWTGASFTIPEGWEMDPTSTSTNLTFYNSSDWTTEDPYFEIPVRAIAPRDNPAWSVGTQVFNIGGDWVDDGQFNWTISGVTVEDAALPVSLVSFEAIREGNTANLRWSTTEEANSDRFEIEHSLNAKNWATIGTVKSGGESKTFRSYTYADTSPVSGTNYYRLKIIDNDNTFAYSPIESLEFGYVKEFVRLYPNPVSEELHVEIRDWSRVNNVALLDINGRTVRRIQDTKPVDITTLAPGTYVVRITGTDGLSNAHKVIIAR